MRPAPRFRQLHMVGMAGAGMSSLAEAFLGWGFIVSGSDLRGGAEMERLKSLGATVFNGHSRDQVDNPDAVIYSAAVSQANPEIAEARRKGIPLIKRSELLGLLMRKMRTIAVCGTHGKTTTACILARIWQRCGWDPSAIIGGRDLEENFPSAGMGEDLIAEADEYDKSFLAMWPTVVVVNNIEREHIECYPTMDDLCGAFGKFLSHVPFYGTILGNGDDPNVMTAMQQSNVRGVTFGFGKGCIYRADHISIGPSGSRFTMYKGTEKLGDVKLSLTGEHNIRNALGALATAREEEMDWDTSLQVLEDFQGVQKRMQKMGQMGGVDVYVDYAHHPTEVRETLKALRFITRKNLIAVLQPHLFSRTQAMTGEFADALQLADKVLVTEIYASRETQENTSGSEIVEKLKVLKKEHVKFISTLEKLPNEVKTISADGDVVVLMGAGDIGEWSDSVLEALS